MIFDAKLGEDATQVVNSRLSPNHMATPNLTRGL